MSMHHQLGLTDNVLFTLECECCSPIARVLNFDTSQQGRIGLYLKFSSCNFELPFNGLRICIELSEHLQ